MSHPTIATLPSETGELHDYARAAWRQARAAQADGLFAIAAVWWEASADAYAGLATLARGYRAVAWQHLGDDAETHGYRAWDAARADGLLRAHEREVR